MKLAEEKWKQECDSLRVKLKRSSDHLKHVEKKVKIMNEKLKSNGLRTHETRAAPVIIPNEHGKLPKGACKNCWDAGLGFRRHAKCDPEKHKQAVLKKMERE